MSKELTTKQLEQIGSRGGNVSTANEAWQEKQRIDKAVNDGKKAANR